MFLEPIILFGTLMEAQPLRPLFFLLKEKAFYLKTARERKLVKEVSYRFGFHYFCIKFFLSSHY